MMQTIRWNVTLSLPSNLKIISIQSSIWVFFTLSYKFYTALNLTFENIHKNNTLWHMYSSKHLSSSSVMWVIMILTKYNLRRHTLRMWLLTNNCIIKLIHIFIFLETVPTTDVIIIFNPIPLTEMIHKNN